MIKNLIAITLVLSLSNLVAARPVKVDRGGATQEITLPEFTIEFNLPGKGEAGKGPTKVGCGGDCNDGASKKTSTATLPVLTSAAEVSVADILKVAQKEVDEAARDYVWNLEQDSKPLETDIEMVDKAWKKLSKFIPNLQRNLKDALNPGDIGLTDFDKANGKKAMQALREHLEYNEKELKRQKEADQEAYENNTMYLFPEVTEQPAIRGPASVDDAKKQARFEQSILSLARLKSSDFEIVVDHLIRRSKIDAPIRLTVKESERSVKVLDLFVEANMCSINREQGCVLYGIPKGARCYCPKYTSEVHWMPVAGYAGKRPTSRYCRTGTNQTELFQELPIGVTCRIPVDLTNGRFMYLEGKVESFDRRLY